MAFGHAMRLISLCHLVNSSVQGSWADEHHPFETER